jgi:hypothetical protein
MRLIQRVYADAMHALGIGPEPRVGGKGAAPRRRLSPPQPISAPLESQLALSALVAMDDSVKQAVDVLRRLLRKVRPTLPSPVS